MPWEGISCLPDYIDRSLSPADLARMMTNKTFLKGHGQKLSRRSVVTLPSLWSWDIIIYWIFAAQTCCGGRFFKYSLLSFFIQSVSPFFIYCQYFQCCSSTFNIVWMSIVDFRFICSLLSRNESRLIRSSVCLSVHPSICLSVFPPLITFELSSMKTVNIERKVW
jgi:hypothetical protein